MRDKRAPKDVCGEATQDLDFPNLAARSRIFQNLPAKIGIYQTLPAGKIWNFPNLAIFSFAVNVLKTHWKIQYLAGKICKIQYLAGKIWKIQYLVGKIWKIQYLVGKIWKIQDLATHHLLPRCSNSRRITHQLACPIFFVFNLYKTDFPTNPTWIDEYRPITI